MHCNCISYTQTDVCIGAVYLWLAKTRIVFTRFAIPRSGARTMRARKLSHAYEHAHTHSHEHTLHFTYSAQPQLGDSFAAFSHSDGAGGRWHENDAAACVIAQTQNSPTQSQLLVHSECVWCIHTIKKNHATSFWSGSVRLSCAHFGYSSRSAKACANRFFYCSSRMSRQHSHKGVELPPLLLDKCKFHPT